MNYFNGDKIMKRSAIAIAVCMSTTLSANAMINAVNSSTDGPQNPESITSSMSTALSANATNVLNHPAIDSDQQIRLYKNPNPPINVALAFGVYNGLPGMMRGVILKLTGIIRFEDAEIKTIFGICEECYLWKKHPCFVDARKDFVVFLRKEIDQFVDKAVENIIKNQDVELVPELSLSGAVIDVFSWVFEVDQGTILSRDMFIRMLPSHVISGERLQRIQEATEKYRTVVKNLSTPELIAYIQSSKYAKLNLRKKQVVTQEFDFRELNDSELKSLRGLWFISKLPRRDKEIIAVSTKGQVQRWVTEKYLMRCPIEEIVFYLRHHEDKFASWQIRIMENRLKLMRIFVKEHLPDTQAEDRFVHNGSIFTGLRSALFW